MTQAATVRHLPTMAAHYSPAVLPVKTHVTACPPALFAAVSEELFRPLSDHYPALYWSILAALYERKFESVALELPRREAVEIAEDVLRESPEWAERREALVAGTDAPDAAASADSFASEDTVLRRTAGRLVSRLERSGWFYFEYYKGIGEVLNFRPHPARIMGALMSAARDEQPPLPGFAHGVALLLQPESVAAKPGLAIAGVKRQTMEFSRELKILHGSIRESTERLTAREITAAGILEEALDRYEDRVRRNYHQLKTRDNFYRWRLDIVSRLDQLEGDDWVIEEAARWYAEQARVAPDAGRERVLEDLESIRQQIDSLPRVLREIDERNQRFTGIALRRLTYLLKNDARTEAHLQGIIELLVRREVDGLDVPLYRCELLGDSFLYRPRRRRAPVAPQPVAARPPVDETAVRTAFAKRIADPYSRARLEAYVQALLDGRESVATSDLRVGSDADYVRLIHVVGLAGRAAFVFAPDACPQGCAGGCDACRVDAGQYVLPAGHLSLAPPKP
ncbi:Wadjet anti-phage system protein JetA family protein [Longimicrobium sp.]|uniref:Wadjet anti-phage system protein JetA family protein n=1 Tax=Longimicrobium sp. TaxID=2029185 RepID=UPI002ED85E42